MNAGSQGGNIQLPKRGIVAASGHVVVVGVPHNSNINRSYIKHTSLNTYELCH
jgi:hypothetical protein